MNDKQHIDDAVGGMTTDKEINYYPTILYIPLKRSLYPCTTGFNYYVKVCILKNTGKPYQITPTSKLFNTVPKSV